MTREEFEALLRMDGEWLEVIPEHGSIRGYKKWYTPWLASIKTTIDQKDIDDINDLMKKLNMGTVTEYNELTEEDRIQTVRRVRARTNHEAVKLLIKDYIKRIEYRANYRR